MDDFKYSFHNSRDARAFPDQGNSAIVRDMERLLISRVGFAPAYAPYDEKAIHDPPCVVVSINPTIDTVQRDWNDRWIGIHVKSTPSPARETLQVCDFVLEPSFMPYTLWQKDAFKRDVSVIPIHAYPSRVTPAVIREAAQSYLADPENRKKISAHGPLTTIAVGDLSYPGPNGELGPNKWRPQEVISVLKDMVTKRGGQVLLTTSPRTKEEDARDLVDALRPNLADFYLWRKGDEANNPYPAFLGLCLDESENSRREAILPGDSLSMICDGVASGLPMRIVDDRQNGQYPAQKLTDALVGQGVKFNGDDLGIAAPPKIETGLEAAIDAVGCGIERKAGELVRRRGGQWLAAVS